jgi:hypothetical protein
LMATAKPIAVARALIKSVNAKSWVRSLAIKPEPAIAKASKAVAMNSATGGLRLDKTLLL